jgi:hypothetical protein
MRQHETGTGTGNSMIRLFNLIAAASLAGRAACEAPPSALFANPADASKIPSSYDSAIMGRRVLALSKLATLSTTFPSSSSHMREDDGYDGSEDDADLAPQERRPSGLGNMPIGLMDYVADCEDSGDPTLLAINIATTFKNVRAGSNITLSMCWTPPYPPSKRISLTSRLSAYVSSLLSGASSSDEAHYSPSGQPDPVPYSAANLPRFSLLGYLEPIDLEQEEEDEEDEEKESTASRLGQCFTAKHPDAKYWLPGNRIHESQWARLVVQQVYWVGGFGDRAYIGWIPVDEWKNVTAEEWRSVRLPGEEKDWEEWTVDLPGEL